MAQWHLNTKTTTGEEMDVVFRLDIIKEADKLGIDWLSREFLVYQQIRWYENVGKFGFMVASVEHLTEVFIGSTVYEIENCIKELQKKGAISHVWCDKKVYRNKTKIWMSTVRLAGAGTSVEAMKVLPRGRKNAAELTTNPLTLKAIEHAQTGGQPTETGGQPTETGGQPPETGGQPTGRTPVTTPVGNNNKYKVNNPSRLCSMDSPSSPISSSTESSTEPSTEPSTDTSSLTGNGKESSVDVKITTVDKDPFGGEVKNVKKKRDQKTVRVATLANELANIYNPGAVAGGILRGVVTARLNENYTPEQLRLVARYAKTDPRLSEFALPALLGEKMFGGLLNAATQKKKVDNPLWRGLSPY